MRIGINALSVTLGNSIRIYLSYLIRNLAKIDRVNDYFIFASQHHRQLVDIQQTNFKTILVPIKDDNRIKRIIFEQTVFPKLIRKYGIDVFHSPSNVLPLGCHCKSVLTIHYMINFLMPRYFTPAHKRWSTKLLMRFSAKKAHKIISVSHSDKREMERFLKVKGENIAVIYHGVDECFSPNIDKTIFLEYARKYRIGRPYIFHVSSFVKHKNVERLIIAVDYLKRKYMIPHQLVLVGLIDPSDYEIGRLQRIIKCTNNLKHGDVILTGYIHHAELPALYSEADVFVLPSLYESFGIPLIEAMKCGVPVVTSDKYAMPEIVGNAGLTINPYDPKDIAKGIYRILENPNLKEELIAKGFGHASRFGWEKTAQETLNVYENVTKMNA
jgi:glycosyltransferase involved in cell wall biosynthesis